MRIDDLFDGAIQPQRSFEPADQGQLASRAAVSERYTLLRGAIGQLAGALLVYRHAGRLETGAIEALVAGTEERVTLSANIGIEGKLGPEVRTIVRACNVAAGLLHRAAMQIRSSLKAGGGGLDQAEAAIEPLRRAYNFLARAASEREGCTMIGFATCCCCSTGLKTIGAV